MHWGRWLVSGQAAACASTSLSWLCRYISPLFCHIVSSCLCGVWLLGLRPLPKSHTPLNHAPPPLHSALVSGQAAARASTSLSQLCRYNFLDIAAALGLALVVNVAVLLTAAATFHQAGV